MHDHHDFRRPVGCAVRRADCLEAAAFSVFAGVLTMALGAASGMRTTGLADLAVAMAAVKSLMGACG